MLDPHLRTLYDTPARPYPSLVSWPLLPPPCVVADVADATVIFDQWSGAMLDADAVGAFVARHGHLFGRFDDAVVALADTFDEQPSRTQGADEAGNFVTGGPQVYGERVHDGGGDVGRRCRVPNIAPQHRGEPGQSQRLTWRTHQEGGAEQAALQQPRRPRQGLVHIEGPPAQRRSRRVAGHLSSGHVAESLEPIDEQVEQLGLGVGLEQRCQARLTAVKMLAPSGKPMQCGIFPGAALRPRWRTNPPWLMAKQATARSPAQGMLRCIHLVGDPWWTGGATSRRSWAARCLRSISSAGALVGGNRNPVHR